MVSEDDSFPPTSLRSLAIHCLESDDVVIYLPFFFGWGELVAVLNQYDGDWPRAKRIEIHASGINLVDRSDYLVTYPWHHFGINPVES